MGKPFATCTVASGWRPSPHTMLYRVGSATVMEAIASGTPIVGSRSLSRDVLAESVNGLVADIKAENMAGAFRTVLDDDPLWSRLSEGAGRMAERFDAHRVARQYLGLVKVKAGTTRAAWLPPIGKAARPHRAVESSYGGR